MVQTELKIDASQESYHILKFVYIPFANAKKTDLTHSARAPPLLSRIPLSSPTSTLHTRSPLRRVEMAD